MLWVEEKTEFSWTPSLPLPLGVATLPQPSLVHGQPSLQERLSQSASHRGKNPVKTGLNPMTPINQSNFTDFNWCLGHMRHSLTYSHNNSYCGQYLNVFISQLLPCTKPLLETGLAPVSLWECLLTLLPIPSASFSALKIISRPHLLSSLSTWRDLVFLKLAKSLPSCFPSPFQTMWMCIFRFPYTLSFLRVKGPLNKRKCLAQSNQPLWLILWWET